MYRCPTDVSAYTATFYGSITSSSFTRVLHDFDTRTSTNRPLSIVYAFCSAHSVLNGTYVRERDMWTEQKHVILSLVTVFYTV